MGWGSARLWGSTSGKYPSGGVELGQPREVWAARLTSLHSRSSLGGPAHGLLNWEGGKKSGDGVWGHCSEKGFEGASGKKLTVGVGSGRPWGLLKKRIPDNAKELHF